jgi:hypothetical protein
MGVTSPLLMRVMIGVSYNGIVCPSVAIAPRYSHDLAISACREPVTRSGLALQVEQVLVEYGLPLLAWPILIIQKGMD